MTTMLEDSQKFDPTHRRVEEKLPDKNVRVIVVCRDSRCLAYLDDNGVWRRHYGNEELTDVIGWIP
jgi:hypothetical protein